MNALPRGWTNLTLADAVVGNTPIIYGILQPGPDVDGGVPYVRPTEIRNGGILLDELRRTTSEIADRYEPHVLAITLATSLGVRRAHAISGIVEQHSGQKINVGMRCRAAWCRRLARDHLLHPCELEDIYEGLMFAVVNVLVMLELADVDRVGNQLVEHAGANRARVAGCRCVRLLIGGGRFARHLCRQRRHGVQFEISGEQTSDEAGLGLLNQELAAVDMISEWDSSSHPHALGLQCGDLVADALCRDLPLELSE